SSSRARARGLRSKFPELKRLSSERPYGVTYVTCTSLPLCHRCHPEAQFIVLTGLPLAVLLSQAVASGDLFEPSAGCVMLVLCPFFIRPVCSVDIHIVH